MIVVNADARQALTRIPPGSIDMILTDPPYGIGWKNAQRTTIQNDSPGGLHVVEDIVRQCQPLLRPGGAALWFAAGGRPLLLSQWTSLLENSGLEIDDLLIWRKPGMAFGSRYRRTYETIIVTHAPGGPLRWFGDHSQPDVIDAPRGRSIAGHPTPKPIVLLERLIRLHSLPGETILDPFAGTGSTLAAAANCGRRAIGIEIDLRWAAEASRR